MLEHRGIALDIGAGEGQIMEYLITRFGKVFALEPSDHYYLELEKKHAQDVKVTLEHQMFERYQTDLQFDAIFIMGVLEHVIDPISFLKKAKSHLSPWGKIFLSVPNSNSLHRMLGREMGLLTQMDELGEHDIKVGYKRYYCFDAIASDVEEAGLEVQHICGMFLKPFANTQMEGLSKDQCDALYNVSNLFTNNCAEIFLVAK